MYTNSAIKSNRNISVQLYILNIFNKKYERFEISEIFPVYKNTQIYLPKLQHVLGNNWPM
jgi:hypothetical protein